MRAKQLCSATLRFVVSGGSWRLEERLKVAIVRDNLVGNRIGSFERTPDG